MLFQLLFCKYEPIRSTRYHHKIIHPDHPYGCHEWPAVVMEVAEAVEPDKRAGLLRTGTRQGPDPVGVLTTCHWVLPWCT